MQPAERGTVLLGRAVELGGSEWQPVRGPIRSCLYEPERVGRPVRLPELNRAA